MTAHTFRPTRLLAAVAIAGVLLAGAHASAASSDAPTGCHGLSPASAQNCAADVFAP